MANGSPDEGRTWWLDRKENVTKVARTLYVVCALLLLADFIIHRHAETDVDGLFGFYGFYGFLGSVFLVMSAKEILRRIVKRSEDYYDD
jgi:hypothetical protein